MLWPVFPILNSVDSDLVRVSTWSVDISNRHLHRSGAIVGCSEKKLYWLAGRESMSMYLQQAANISWRGLRRDNGTPDQDDGCKVPCFSTHGVALI